MILHRLPGLLAASALAACVVTPAVAQGVPYPRPRPAHLTVKTAPVITAPAPVMAAPVPVAAAPAPVVASPPMAMAPVTAAPAPPPPVAAAPAQQVPSAQAPTSIGEIAAASTLQSAPAASAPPAEAATEMAAAPATETVAAPLNLSAPQPGTIEVGPAPGAALAAANPVDAPSEAQTLSRVNSYFNGIRTLVGNFTQVGPDGSRADGKFFLQKPGKVRFYYQRPSTTDIIADGRSLVVRDRKLATQDVYPLSQTPLKFLLDTNMDLSRDSKVTAVYEEPGLISVAIEEETTFGGKARILLVFGTENKKTFELKQWTITDPQGLDTTVALSDLDTTTRPDEKLFAVDYTHDNSERR
jgi:outer membrane lipoprotein-sorting protein